MTKPSIPFLSAALIFAAATGLGQVPAPLPTPALTLTASQQRTVQEIGAGAKAGGLDAYRWSQIARASALALDLASSRGLREVGGGAFGLYRFDGEKFGAKHAAIAIGVEGAAMIGMELAARKWPFARKVATWVNFGAAGAHGMAAVCNWGRC